MNFLVRRSRSTSWWFKMDVPARHRAAVGKTAWWQSLNTSDHAIAAQKVTKLAAEHKQLLLELDGRAETRAAELVDKFVDGAMAAAASVHGSMDRAVVHQLVFLTMHVGSGWMLKQAVSDLGRFLDDPRLLAEGVSLGAAAFEEQAEQKAYELRALLIEGRGIADGLVYQEVAKRLLARREFDLAYPAIVDLARNAGDPDNLLETAYGHVAEAYLKRLAEHVFDSWPDGMLEALAPLAASGPSNAPATYQAAANPTVAKAPVLEGLLAKSLSESMSYWQEQRRPGRSAVTEAKRSVERFVALFGDLAIGEIQRATVIEFRNLIADIPPQTELGKLRAANRTLRAAIEDHRERLARWKAGDRSIPEPKRVAPATVKKDVGALSQILGKIADDVGDGSHAASGITVDGYTKTKKGQKRPRLSFPPAMMQKLFDSPLFTGCAGKSDMERTRPGPCLYQDELYWPFLFGVIGGPRLEEIGQIALSDVHDCDLGRTFGEEHTGSCTFIHITGTGADQEVKNDGSDRFVVIHDRLIELGFKDYVERRRLDGKTKLFDLSLDKSGKHTKSLSNRLNRYIDRVVTEDSRYVYHSMRHEFTDRAELSMMPTRVANSIKGHANTGVADNYGLVSILAQHQHLNKLNVGFIDWKRLIAAAHRAGVKSGIR